jgi:hypothetical protein
MIRGKLSNESERKYLLVCLKGIDGNSARHNHFLKIGLERKQINRLTKKFEKKEWVIHTKNNDYLINLEKKEEIKKYLDENESRESEWGIGFDNMKKYLVISLSVIITIGIIWGLMAKINILSPKESIQWSVEMETSPHPTETTTVYCFDSKENILNKTWNKNQTEGECFNLSKNSYLKNSAL